MKFKKLLTIGLVSFLSLTGCTNLDENIDDKYTTDEFYGTPEGSDVALAAVYAQISGNWNGVGYAGADNGWYYLFIGTHRV